MIRIRKVPILTTEMDDAGQIVERVIYGPETPVFPLSVHHPNAVKVESDGEFYTVYEPGD